MRVYYDRDADLNLIKGKKVAVVGYGSQGHAHVLNMRDSGVKDIVAALRTNSPSVKKAEGEEHQGARRRQRGQMGRHRHDADAGRIAGRHLPQRTRAAHEATAPALMFAHGLNVHFNLIEPRADIDVLMIAPKGPGHTVRSEYKRGGGVPCLLAIRLEDARRQQPMISGCPTPRRSAASRARSVIEHLRSARNARETDLFGEQVVLCGGLVELIRAGYETLDGSRLCAGNGLFRVPARGEADRRPLSTRAASPT